MSDRDFSSLVSKSSSNQTDNLVPSTSRNRGKLESKLRGHNVKSSGVKHRKKESAATLRKKDSDKTKTASKSLSNERQSNEESEESDVEFTTASMKQEIKHLNRKIEILTDLVMSKLEQTNNEPVETPPVAREELIAGEFLTQSRPSNNAVSFSSGLSAGDNLSDKIRNKIWNNKYIDFYHILYPETEDTYAFSMNDSGTAPTLELLPKKRRPLTDKEWCKAFDDFLAVYTKKYPNEIQDLISYGKFIKQLMNCGHNWFMYDTQFRKDREFSLCKWTTLRVDLHFTATNTPSTSSQRSVTMPISTSLSIPKGFCFAYHSRDKKCYNKMCRWSHSCPRCSSVHPSYYSCMRDRPNQHFQSPMNANHNQAEVNSNLNRFQLNDRRTISNSMNYSQNSNFRKPSIPSANSNQLKTVGNPTRPIQK